VPTRDLSALFGSSFDYPDVPSKEYPDGKTYRVPSPSAEVGARLTAQAAVGLKAARGGLLTEKEQALLDLDDEEEKSFYEEILGPVYEEMLADGVDWTLLANIARDAYMCITDNEGLADAVLAAAGEAHARENRATKRATKTGRGSRAAGSSSSRASGRTQARTGQRPATTPASGPSSTSPSDGEGRQQQAS